MRTGELVTKETIDHLKTMVNVGLPITYLAIDPGKSNGVCGYTSDCTLSFMLTVPASLMVQFLHIFDKVKFCILEDFKLFPNKAKKQHYSDMETSRVIGRVETWAELRNVTLVKQMSSIKSNGYNFIGMKPLPKSNPKNHSLDAHVHFMYWAITRGIIDPKKVLENL